MFLLQAILFYSLCWRVLKTILRFSDSLGALTGFTKYLYSWLIFITVKKNYKEKSAKGKVAWDSLEENKLKLPWVLSQWRNTDEINSPSNEL